jgi:CRP-like cAMP-binding protein
MNYTSVTQNLMRYTQFEPTEVDFFTARLVYKELPKKAHLLQAGKTCRKIFYVQSGALRAYFVDKNGRESTIMFAVADWWVTDMYCFVNSLPAMLSIEAIEHSTFFELSQDHLNQLFTQMPKFERWFRILMQNAYSREQLRVIESLSLTAEERYQKFLQRYPQMIKHLTQKQIASYLGITPEFLSTIRKQQSKKSDS